MMKLILASGSPRRRELLEAAGIPFSVEVSEAEEVYTEKLPAGIVTELSAVKASAVAALHQGKEAREGLLILGADTVVAADGEILGKPRTEEEAREMIRKISGRTHFVYTGVCLLRLEPDEEGKLKETGRKNFPVGTEVFVVPLTEAEISAYVAEGESMDKAGAYAIQGGFGKYIDHIEGDYENVIGLPVKAVIEAIGTLSGEEVPEAEVPEKDHAKEELSEEGTAEEKEGENHDLRDQ